MYPIASEVKAADVFRFNTARSTAVANTGDKVQNIVGTIDAKLKSDAGNVDHRTYDYVGFIPPTATDYPAAKIGSRYLELYPVAGTVTDACEWLLTAAGWVKQSRQERLRNIKSFGSTSSQYDVTKSGNIVRFTFDGTGTAPLFTTGGLKVGDKVVVGEDFNAANQGTFVVLTVAATYFEVYNALGVAEEDVVTDAAAALMMSSLTVDTDDDIVVVNNSGATTLVLRTAVGCTGKVLTIKNVGAGVASVDANGSQTIDGLLVLAVPSMATAKIISDGANWLVLSLLEPAVGVTALSNAAATPTAAQIRLGLFTMTPGEARDFTLPTAALMYAVAPSGAVGTYMDFVIENVAADTHAITVVASATGLTNGGHANSLVVAAATAATFRVRFTSSTAAVVYRVG